MHNVQNAHSINNKVENRSELCIGLMTTLDEQTVNGVTVDKEHTNCALFAY